MEKIGWITTNRNCNNKCKWCYANDFLLQKKCLNIDDAKKIVDLFRSNNVKRVVLIGGESILYPHLFNLVGYVFENGMTPVLLTNGAAFSDKRLCEKIHAIGLDKICVSLKGFNETDYLNSTGSNNFNKVVTGIQNLEEVGITPSISITVTRHISENVNNYLHLLKQVKAKKVIFDFAKPYYNNGILCNNDILNPLEMARFCETHYLEFFNSFDFFKISIEFPVCFINREKFLDIKSKNILDIGCFILSQNGIFIDIDMNMMMCNIDVHNHKGKLSEKHGKYFINERINDLEINERFYAKFDKICQGCVYRNSCRGGCHFIWDFYNINDFLGDFQRYE
jgi:radical SAM protein with 4Fe4S-binding SPASM domain